MTSEDLEGATIGDVSSTTWKAFLKLLISAFPGMKKRMISLTVLAIIAAVIEAGIVLVIAAVGSMLVDSQSASTRSLFGQTITLTIAQLTWMILAAALLRAVVDLLLIEIRARTEAAYESAARRRVARLYLAADWDLQSNERSGGLQALLVGFISHARGLLQQVTSTIVSISSLLIMLGASFLVGRMATVLAILFLAFVAFMLRSYVRRNRQAAVANREATVRFSDRISETVAMALEVRTLGVSNEVSQRLGEDIDDLASAQYHSSTASYRLSSIHNTLTYVAVGAGMLALVLLNVSDPQPYAAMILLLYRTMVYGRAVQAGYQNIAGAQAYLEILDSRMAEYRNAREDRGAGAPSRVGDLAFDRVSFSYRSDTPALNEVTFAIKPGEALGIVGPSGAGKSTIVQVMLGLRHPHTGLVTLDGVDMRSVSPDALTKLVGYVPQEAHLFDAPVVDNVICFRPWVTRKRAIHALEQAQVLAEVRSMADGLETSVGLGGRQLSGGQRQRVCIARALAGDPGLLILDEPTSALDLASEEAIRLTLEGLRGDLSLAIIAHRMSTLRVCDRVLVLANGKVEAFGLRANIEADSAYYAEALRLAKLT